MLLSHPVRLIFIGGFLVTFGMVVPFLMVIQVISSSFILSFLSYIASFLGLMFGIIGAALYVREDKERKNHQKRAEWWEQEDEENH